MSYPSQSITKLSLQVAEMSQPRKERLDKLMTIHKKLDKSSDKTAFVAIVLFSGALAYNAFCNTTVINALACTVAVLIPTCICFSEMDDANKVKKLIANLKGPHWNSYMRKADLFIYKWEEQNSK